ncbi:MAG: MBL fold metallo-hydrolase [Saprospiraceae bacterium]|nr:MAG: hydrolase [Bacteroidetes bacterium OLB9]MCO6463507.1 MBL fold metallo-hydrolase [Saprospiraceae bacterium]MCZ2339192.1 MBL fold metallo-hydrolase [Chitinophagales bacterium]
MRVTFLGTGTSQGIPVIGCSCSVCTSTDDRDRRLRTSAAVEKDGKVIVIDVGPDFRQQMLTNHIGRIDAVLITHEHNDHVTGLDDIRPYNFMQSMKIPVYGLGRVLENIESRFPYIFDKDPYPGAPGVMTHIVKADHPFKISTGIEVIPVPVMHGDLPIIGYRIDSFAYITDASYISESSKKILRNLDILVLNALRYKKHHSHFNFDEAIEMAQLIGAQKTYFTHISHEMETYEAILQKCPSGIYPAYDGLTLEI